MKVTQHGLDPILPLSVPLHGLNELPRRVRLKTGPACVALDKPEEINPSPRCGIPGTPCFIELDDPQDIKSKPYWLGTPSTMRRIHEATSPLNSVCAAALDDQGPNNTSDTESPKHGRHSKKAKSILRTSCTFIERADRVGAAGKAINVLKRVSQYCSSVKEDQSSVYTERMSVLESHKSDMLAKYGENNNSMNQDHQGNQRNREEGRLCVCESKNELNNVMTIGPSPCTSTRRSKKSHFAVSFADQVPVEFSGGTATYTTTRNLAETKLVERYMTADMVYRPRILPERITHSWTQSTHFSSVCSTAVIVVFIVAIFMTLLLFSNP